MKKRLTAVFDGETMPDLTALLQVALEFKIDTIDDGTAPAPVRLVHRAGGGRIASNVIMDHYTPQGEFRRDTAIAWLVAAKYNKNTISTALLPLLKNGNVRDLGGGRYQFLQPMPAKKP